METYKVIRLRESSQAVSEVLPMSSMIVNYYDVTIVFEGEMQYADSESRYNLRGGDIIVFCPGDERIRFHSDKVMTKYFSVNFLSERELDLPRVIQNGITPEIKQLLNILERHFKSHSPRRAEKLSDTVSLLVSELLDIRDEMGQNPHVREILAYIYAHFSETDISLNRIAKKLGLAPNYCSYLVKKELNTTIFDIIIRERILMAEDYILQGKLSLADIAEKCGFNSYSYFSYMFKKHTGFSPTNFRRK